MNVFFLSLKRTQKHKKILIFRHPVQILGHFSGIPPPLQTPLLSHQRVEVEIRKVFVSLRIDFRYDVREHSAYKEIKDQFIIDSLHYRNPSP